MEEIIVRPAAPGDLDAVWALVRRAVQKMREEGSEQWGEDYPTRADYEEDLRRGRLAAAVSAQGQVLTSRRPPMPGCPGPWRALPWSSTGWRWTRRSSAAAWPPPC